MRTNRRVGSALGYKPLQDAFGPGQWLKDRHRVAVLGDLERLAEPDTVKVNAEVLADFTHSHAHWPCHVAQSSTIPP